MKLRNKKTGEILGGLGSFIIQNPNGINCEAITKYDSLAELNAEWEDFEEPKEYWYIDDAGVIQIDQVLSSEINMRKSIGNYFDTREEAEKAVEKLKAWKRLKDGGLVIKKWSHTPDMHLITGSFLKIEGFIPAIMKNIKDLDLLFGGEE